MKKSAKTKKGAKQKKGVKPKTSVKAKRGPTIKSKRGGGKKSKKGKRKVRMSKAFYATSERLGYRLLGPGDQALYCELFTDAKAMEFVGPPLSRERAELSFKKALEVTQSTPFKQRIVVIVELASGEPIGISSLKLIDPEKRHAEGGILLKPTAQAQRFAIEGSLAGIDEAFKWHSIDELHARVHADHHAGERLVVSSGYARGTDTPANEGQPATKGWYITRAAWATNSIKR